MPSEAALRAAFQRVNLPLKFEDAMQRPAVARSLECAARYLGRDNKHGRRR